MIISCSRRTDIPAYYSEWFYYRISKGFCHVPNPYNSRQVSYIDLRPEAVTAIAFWSRNPSPLMKKMNILDDMGFHYYFLFTLNNYPINIEPNKLSLSTSLDTFRILSGRIGINRVIWRYDPVILNDSFSKEYHLENFGTIAFELSGFTAKVITSFVEPYQKTLRRMNTSGSPLIEHGKETIDHSIDLLNNMSITAAANNIKLETCCIKPDIPMQNIEKTRCIDDRLLSREFGLNIKYKKDKSQRPSCQCHISRDIGMNNTCLSGCSYCYATLSHNLAVKNRKKHYPACSSLLPVRCYP